MIIDIHTHLWGGRYREDAKRMLEAMDAYGIDEIYVSGLHSQFPPKEGVEEANAEVHRYCTENPGRVFGYAFVSPEHDNAVDVVRRGIEDMGFIGIKLWCSVFCDDACVNPVIEQAINYGVPVLLHSFHKANGQAKNETVGVNVARLARRYPEAKLIMAHLSGNCYDGIRAVRDLPNVWLDFCGSIFQQDALDYALEYVGADRLLHGSDMPGNYLVNLGQVIALDIDEESRAKILGGNAKRLFDRSFRL